jgi:hypothetical protein
LLFLPHHPNLLDLLTKAEPLLSRMRPRKLS